MFFVPVIWKEKDVDEGSLLVGLRLGILKPGAKLYFFLASGPCTAITF